MGIQLVVTRNKKFEDDCDLKMYHLVSQMREQLLRMNCSRRIRTVCCYSHSSYEPEYLILTQTGRKFKEFLLGRKNQEYWKYRDSSYTVYLQDLAFQLVFSELRI
jgi:hypothetical protein